jgi:hypothetical protein
MQKNGGIEKRSIDESLFSMVEDNNRTGLVRVKRDDYTEYKWAPGYVVGTSPQVTTTSNSSQSDYIIHDFRSKYVFFLQQCTVPSTL